MEGCRVLEEFLPRKFPYRFRNECPLKSNNVAPALAKRLSACVSAAERTVSAHCLHVMVRGALTESR